MFGDIDGNDGIGGNDHAQADTVQRYENLNRPRDQLMTERDLNDIPDNVEPAMLNHLYV